MRVLVRYREADAVELLVGSTAEVRYEQKYGADVGTVYDGAARTPFYQLVHQAALVEGETTTEEFDGWLASVEEVLVAPRDPGQTLVNIAHRLDAAGVDAMVKVLQGIADVKRGAPDGGAGEEPPAADPPGGGTTRRRAASPSRSSGRAKASTSSKRSSGNTRT